MVMVGSSSISIRLMVDLPAPEGEESTISRPRRVRCDWSMRALAIGRASASMLHVRTKHLKSCAAHYIVQCNKGMNMTDTVNNETFETAAEQAEPVEAAVVEAVKKVNARRVKTERKPRARKAAGGQNVKNTTPRA